MTKKSDLKTDVNLDMHITDEPHEIAEKLMNGLLMPVLNRKMQVSGLEESVQVYRDLAYLLVANRVGMIGHKGIQEMRDLLDEFEDELSDFGIVQLKASDYLELSQRVS